MNRLSELSLKVLRRKIYPRINKFTNNIFFRHKIGDQKNENKNKIVSSISQVNQILFDAIQKGRPFMVARFGSVELSAVSNYVGVKNNPHSIIKYIKGEINEWWWNWKSIAQLESNAGFFPITESNLILFGELFLKDSRSIDVLGSWCEEEKFLDKELSKALKVRLETIRPDFYWDGASPNWLQALKNKKVLIIHPFAESIKKQYLKKALLFPRKDFMPDFDLKIIKAVQSIGGTSEFPNWFDALDFMKNEMDKIDYDVAIIGCGAYGLPLAAHAKRTGHIAIHLGGVTQLLFGIKGKRWENQEYWQKLFNENWVRPDSTEKPASASSVEGGCYW